MTNAELNALLDLTQEQIAALTGDAYKKLLARVLAGEAPQAVVADIQKGWSGKYQETLAGAFSRVMGHAVGSAYVQNIPVGDVVLSQHLYHHNQRVTAVVAGLIQGHVKGMHDAKALAMQVYEGYGFKAGGDSLAVKADLPKYLKQALDDPNFANGLKAILARGQAATIKTPQMRQAYLNAIDALTSGKGGQGALDKAIKVAWYERNRFFANRIAQTELARVHADQTATEIMGDPDITVVQWRMSQTHPKMDICDLHAKIDRWGLGGGCYPKAKAPKPPAHPFCRCTLAPRIDMVAPANLKERMTADRDFLAHMPQKEAAQIAGSMEKRKAILGGKSLADVINAGRPEPYHMAYVGDVVTGSAAPGIPAPIPVPPPVMAPVLSTPADFIAAGRKITDLFPDGGKDPVRSWEYLVGRLEQEVGISNTVQTVSSGIGADVVKEAATMYPNSWTDAADAFGPLRVRKATPSSRGWAWSADKNQIAKLPIFGELHVRPGDGFMVVRDDIGNAVHELGHRIQSALPKLDAIFQEHHRARTNGDPLQRLLDVVGGSYKPDELTRKDKYVNPYMGKEYAKGGALEMMTMAFQAVLSMKRGGFVKPTGIQSWNDLFYGDRETFDLAVGLLFNWKPIP